MQKLEVVDRQNRNFEQTQVTTVRTLRAIMESVGYDLSDKHCWIKQKGKGIKKALPDYVIQPTDEISFDAMNELPSRDLTITVEDQNRKAVIHMCSTNGTVKAVIA